MAESGELYASLSRRGNGGLQLGMQDNSAEKLKLLSEISPPPFRRLKFDLYHILVENQYFKAGIIIICFSFSDVTKTSLPILVR